MVTRIAAVVFGLLAAPVHAQSYPTREANIKIE